MVLNPNAAAFVPASTQAAHSEDASDQWACYADYYNYDYDYNELEEDLTDEQLEELEAVDAWLDMMVDLEESETEHLIAYALQHAPAAAQVVEEQVLAQQHAGEGHGKKKHRKPQHRSTKSQ